jgi:hypothetical protein
MERATFQAVAQRLKQLRYCVIPRKKKYAWEKAAGPLTSTG